MANAYVLPSKRFSKQPSTNSSTVSNSSTSTVSNSSTSNSNSFLNTTEKKSLKKVFQLQDGKHEFPTLGEALRQTNKANNNNNKPILSFSAMTQKKEVQKPAAPESILLPGWIYIRKNKQGKIEYKEGPLSNHEKARLEADQKAHFRLGQLLTKYRIEQDQYKRDMDIQRLGDLSFYYNQPTLNELFAEVELQYQRESIKTGYPSDYDSSSNNSDYYE
jgi:hypothetical protein